MQTPPHHLKSKTSSALPANKYNMHSRNIQGCTARTHHRLFDSFNKPLRAVQHLILPKSITCKLSNKNFHYSRTQKYEYTLVVHLREQHNTHLHLDNWTRSGGGARFFYRTVASRIALRLSGFSAFLALSSSMERPAMPRDMAVEVTILFLAFLSTSS